jgi:8-oxo-dGTP diphosphatase
MTRATVAAIIRQQESSPELILLTRRSVPPFQGHWCLPGGHIDDYETAEDAVKREVFEETGLVFTDPVFFHYFDELFPEYRFHAVALAFTGFGSGKETLMPEEVAEIRWFTLRDALALPLAFNHLHILQRYAEALQD